MLKQKITEALTTYAGALLWVAHYNLSISLNLKTKGYEKLSSHIRTLYQRHIVQSIEIYDYIARQGTVPQIRDMVDIPITFDSPEEAVERSLVQTLRLTDALESLMDIILQAKDHTSYATFQYLLREQFDEEVLLSKLIEKLKNRC
ncbi:MAG: hypothetical protein IKK64_04305 [Bacteroidales bacterium]|nr:hypothetical protein [Bacteroidales bacterium]